MRLRKLTVQHWRNLALVSLAFDGGKQFLAGANGQGKTNLLEAAGFLTALRSFRTLDPRLLVAHGQTEAALACVVEHERLGETTVTIKLGSAGKEVWCDQERITRLADYVGRFPTVVFSAQDQLLVRGAPALRRRWLDLALAATNAEYLTTLQTYHRALAERNSLLKAGRNGAELAAFDTQLVPAGVRLIALRTESLQVLAAHMRTAYARIAPEAETAGLAYAPDCSAADETAFAALLADSRARDELLKTTQRGPHRDDFEFSLDGRPAPEVASEGQQRGLVLALRLAQVAFFEERTNVRPVLLADDVLGELDPERRRRFWAALDPELQIIATGTSLPDDAIPGRWQVFRVEQGQFTPAA
ncbi:MAG: DNA replication/repair protein RecF [Opitutaceae bacterium]|nr:DNA replication/repair protein RecF [Opitutaceae bacterium]